jgi:Co/Zn/Cd efflux system component
MGARRAVKYAAHLTLGYFVIEFAVALAIGSVALLADSLDFLEDASFNLLVVLALGWTARSRARLAIVLAGLLLLPGLATAWTAWEKFITAAPPAPLPLSLAGMGAIAVNLLCAILLMKHNRHNGSLIKAAFLSARNHVLADLAIIGAGFVTAFVWYSAWPDLIVGVAIAIMNIDAAREIVAAARYEYRQLHV